MTTSIGWLIVQREVSHSVRVAGATEVWLTAVFSTPSRKVVAMCVGDAAGDSLARAVTQAVQAPARGAPTQRPRVVLTASNLVEPVRGLLDQVAIDAGVDEVAVPDWAEDVVAEVLGHVSGRRQAEDPPSPEEWALLYAQAAAYAVAAPWERRADDVHLMLEVRVGTRRSPWVAVVLGNAGVSRGLAMCPGPTLPTSFVSEDETGPPPEGTCSLSLIRTDEAPPELRERATRYGWPEQIDAPLFIAVGPIGAHELDRDQAVALTVGLAAALEHDRREAGLGTRVGGELLLAGGRRGRYTARLQNNVPPTPPPEVQVVSGRLRDDLLPATATMGLGGLPWGGLETVRQRAAIHTPPPQDRPSVGEGLPLLILGVDGTDGERVARILEASQPLGVTLLGTDDDVLVVIVTDAGLFGVTSLDGADTAVARFRQRLAATGGWHGILVSTPATGEDDPVYGFFECVLADPSSTGGRAIAGPPGHPAPRGRRPRRRQR